MCVALLPTRFESSFAKQSKGDADDEGAGGALRDTSDTRRRLDALLSLLLLVVMVISDFWFLI